MGIREPRTTMVAHYLADIHPMKMYLLHRRLLILNITYILVGLWRNHHCDNIKAFVCKRLAGETAPKTDPPTEAVGGFCPEGYMPVRKLDIC